MSVPSEPRPSATELQALLAYCDRMAWWLDDGLRIPGTRFRIGLDAVIGIVPVAGDVLGFAISSYSIWRAARAGVPRRLLLTMGRNVVVDLFASMVPVFGDAFDAVFKAHRRNFELLRREYAALAPTSQSTGKTRSRVLLTAVIAAVIAVAALLIRNHY